MHKSGWGNPGCYFPKSLAWYIIHQNDSLTEVRGWICGLSLLPSGGDEINGDEGEKLAETSVS